MPDEARSRRYGRAPVLDLPDVSDGVSQLRSGRLNRGGFPRLPQFLAICDDDHAFVVTLAATVLGDVVKDSAVIDAGTVMPGNVAVITGLRPEPVE